MIQAIRNFPVPRTITDARSWFGLVLYNCGRIFLYYHFSLAISYSVWSGLELFGLVHVHTFSAGVHVRAQRM